jgi:hypothetical protein
MVPRTLRNQRSADSSAPVLVKIPSAFPGRIAKCTKTSWAGLFAVRIARGASQLRFVLWAHHRSGPPAWRAARAMEAISSMSGCRESQTSATATTGVRAHAPPQGAVTKAVAPPTRSSARKSKPRSSRLEPSRGDRDVLIVGGANIARQYVRAGLLDELEIHIVPILMGGGVRLFEGTQHLALDPTRTVESPDITHVRYRVPK